MDALPSLAPVSGAYARLPIAEAFNWAEGATELGAGEWYLVAFRSIRRADADEARLDEYDERAHQEASASPGFVHYLKGPRADDGSCMSFCLWQSRADARAAAGKPDHIRAVSLLDEMYAVYRLEYLAVRRQADGTMTFEPYPVVAHEHATPTAGAEDPADTGASLPRLAIDPSPAG